MAGQGASPVPTMKPRLKIELVPSTCWWSNVRSNVTRAEWEICKKMVRDRSGGRCEICGGAGKRWPVECHEIWDYHTDISQHRVKLTQTLVGLVALCPDCHRVKHIGRTIRQGVKVLDRAIQHLCRVNGWDADTAEQYINDALRLWDVRSQFSWDLDVSYLSLLGIDVGTLDREKEEDREG